ncbi:MAG: hypothetical protein ACLP8S_31095 [Solirubrobacteraceae bacterium]
MTSGLILAYVEREAGREAVDEMLARAGLTDREQELRDENSWFSFDAKIMLWEAAEAVTGDKRVAERVGESALDFGVALSLKRALRALGSPDFVYRNVARANSKFNWAHRLSIVDNADDHVRLEYRDVSGVGYQHYDCDATSTTTATTPMGCYGRYRSSLACPQHGSPSRFAGRVVMITASSTCSGSAACRGSSVRAYSRAPAPPQWLERARSWTRCCLLSVQGLARLRQ